MPLVRLTVSQHGYQIPPEVPLKQLLIREAGMDASDADAAVRRLIRGKFVDVSFDLGEDQAARALIRNAEAVGLEAKLHRDEPLSWAGSRPRSWFLKLALPVLVGFGICVWLSVTRPDAIVTKVMKVVEGLVIVCWFLSFTLADKRPKTQAQEDWESKLSSRWGLGLFLLVVVTGAIISEPMLGLVLLTLVLGGIGFAFLIRMMNRP
jgi:hypothetical protein